jgi:predicted transcriptional regulator YheO
MALTKEEREVIKKLLPHGFQSKIAKKLKMSRRSVYRYLKGKTNSLRIEKEAVKTYSQYEKELSKMRKIIHG